MVINNLVKNINDWKISSVRLISKLEEYNECYSNARSKSSWDSLAKMNSIELGKRRDALQSVFDAKETNFRLAIEILDSAFEKMDKMISQYARLTIPESTRNVLERIEPEIKEKQQSLSELSH